MKLFNPREWTMWFHYGNCKQDIERLKKENTELKKEFIPLLSQIEEQKGILEYAMHDKEQEIKRLKGELEGLRAKVGSEIDDSNKSIIESWQDDAEKTKTVKRVTAKKR